MDIFKNLEKGIKKKVEEEERPEMDIVIPEVTTEEDFKGYEVDFGLKDILEDPLGGGGGGLELEDDQEKPCITEVSQDIRVAETLYEEKTPKNKAIIVTKPEMPEKEYKIEELEEYRKEEIEVEEKEEEKEEVEEVEEVKKEEVEIGEEEVEEVKEEEVKEEVEIGEEKKEEVEKEEETAGIEKEEEEETEDGIKKEETEVEQEQKEEEPEWLKEVVYYKGMTLEDYIRENKKTKREREYISYLYTKEEIEKAIIGGRVLVRNGVYRV